MYTFLEAVNLSLKESGIIKGATGEITSFTDANIQHFIDRQKADWNDIVQQLYIAHGEPLPLQTDEDSITLQTDTREYSPPADMERIIWPIIDAVNGNTIELYPGGYTRMRLDQLQPSQWTGLPIRAAINPSTGDLRMDTAPTANENGNVYTLFYEKRLSLSVTTDRFPFSDSVVEALVTPVAELFNLDEKQRTNGTFRPNFARAVKYLRGRPARDTW